VALALTPRWWPWHVALLAVLVSFGWLGWWQLASFGAGDATGRSGAGPPASLQRLIEPGGRLDATDVGRRVRAVGSWDGTGQLLVPGRVRAGQLGAWLVTPLRVGDGVVPVVRGWVASPAAAPAPPAGTVTVAGVLARSETEADATTPVGATEAGEIPYLATVTVLAALPYTGGELYDGFLVLRSQQPPDPAAPTVLRDTDQAVGSSTDQPVGGSVGKWRNLAYALQWWVFGVAAAVFWAMVLRRAARDRAEVLARERVQISAPPTTLGDPPRAPLPAPRRRT